MLRIYFIGFILAIATPVAAEYSEIGFHGGSSYYIGDLNPYKHFTHNPKFVAGAFWRYNITDRHAFRVNFTYTNVEGSDAESDNEWRRNRNLQFQSEIIEVS